MDSLTVRRYRPTDAAAVWDVHVRDLSDAMPFFSSAWATDLHDVERHYLGSGDFLVAEHGGTVVATGGFLPEDEATAGLKRGRVLPTWRDSDAFARILVELERLADLRGYDRLTLDTNEHLSNRNRTLESLGYELVDRHPLPEWGVDVLYYEKRL
ncbi:GNAT family N-acetyltransferase [Halomarina rubra]|uniref:GNAT family N-acetyltransferase n=1 Tax=Halomarina rubra TaxID=2071873 RepID=A0ABD6AQG0_9EURY|nr:GNAT family N-acetyltransferase [Halomarina rubra]